MILFKHGISGREILPLRLRHELDMLDTETRLNMSGNYYEDFHVYGSSAMVIDINWSHGAWVIQMRRRNERREIEVTAGQTSRLASEWRNLFLFGGVPLFSAHEDIVLSGFDIHPDRRSVVFSGQFYNHYSGVDCPFRTEFTFSITSHFLKVQTEILRGQYFCPVGVRFMRQPDTPSYDFFKYGGLQSNF